LQDKHLGQIMAQGGTALVINETNINELDELLEKMK
jgi:hypothetical protein